MTTGFSGVLPHQSKIIDPVRAGTLKGLDIWAYLVGNRVGESPSWHPVQRRLYWIDVRAQQLLRLNPKTDEITRWSLPDVVGAMALCASGEVWLAMRKGIYALNTRSHCIHLVTEVETDKPTNRLNDGKVSPTGRWFVFGSMDDRPTKEATGALYCASPSGHIKLLHTGLVVANGIAFSLDAKTIYYSDSFQGLVFKAEWSEATGQMGAPMLWCKLGDAQGRPDGAAVDSSGHYWSAGVSAGCLNILSPDGQVIETLPLPCQAPTMPVFGGDTASTLYVTSLVRPQWSTPGDHDGALLRIDGLTVGKHAALLQNTSKDT